MLDGLVCLHPLAEVRLEDALKELLRIQRYPRPIIREYKHSARDLVDQLGLVLAGKGQVAADGQVHDHAEGPHVGPLVVAAAFRDDLRSSELGTADVRVEDCLAFDERPGGPEVDQLRHRVLCRPGRQEQDVIWPNVPVRNRLGMQIGHGGEQLPHDPHRLSFGEGRVSQDALQHLAALAELHDQMAVKVILEHIEELADVRVVQLLLDVEHRLDAPGRGGLLVHTLHCILHPG
mmetsp:Transcript_4826/g.13409  ORF Transcript_4826/g.13409 Transcript_4826/m.13409 type:complete len:234 (-) Transcript_4826:841-1542(-)